MDSDTPAGWHPDPTGRHHQRYWDGNGWTDQVADASGAIEVDPVAVAASSLDPAPTTAIPTVAAAAAPPAKGGTGKKVLAIVGVLVVAAAAAVGGAMLAGGGDDGDDEVATEITRASTTTTEVEATTTTEAEEETTTTSTTEPGLDDPTDVVGSSIAEALGDLDDAGITATQVEVIDESVPDGQVTQAVEQPDGSVVLTVARPPVTRFLEELPTAQGSVSGPTFNVSGTTYSHGIAAVARSDEGSAFEYDLGRDYRRFTATVGITDGSLSGHRARVEISLDGEIVSTNDLSFGETLAVDLDVTGKLRLRVVLVTLDRGGSCCTDPFIGFGDAKLLGVPSEVPPLQGN